MKKFALKSLFVMSLFLGLAVSLGSCGKVKDSIARVTVINETTGQPMNGVTVILRPESTTGGNPTFRWDEVTAVTDAKGVATFNFNEDYEAGQAGLFVLTIDVESGTDYNTSVGIIKVEEQTTNEKTVEIP